MSECASLLTLAGSGGCLSVAGGQRGELPATSCSALSWRGSPPPEHSAAEQPSAVRSGGRGLGRTSGHTSAAERGIDIHALLTKATIYMEVGRKEADLCSVDKVIVCADDQRGCEEEAADHQLIPALAASHHTARGRGGQRLR